MNREPITTKNGDRYIHNLTNVGAAVENELSTPVGCVRLVSEDGTKAAVTITMATLAAAWRPVHAR